MLLTSNESALVLAALRLLQRNATVPAELTQILGDAGRHLTIDPGTIDDLCQRFNTDGGDTRDALLEALVARFGPAIDDDASIDGGDAVEWLGEFLPRVRDVLSRPRRAARVVVTMDGGVIQNVSADAPLDVKVIDYDTEGLDEDTVTAVPQTDATGTVTGHEDAFVVFASADFDTAWTELQFGASPPPADAAQTMAAVSRETANALRDASVVIGELVAGWPEGELHRAPEELRGQLSVLSLRMERLGGLPESNANEPAIVAAA